ATNQLHVEVAHVEHAFSGFANYRESLLQQFVENLLKHLAALLFDLLLLIDIGNISIWTIRIGGCLVGDRAETVVEKVFETVFETVLDAGAKLRRLGAKLVVGELLYLRFERVDGLHPRLQALDLALVFRPENLA